MKQIDKQKLIEWLSDYEIKFILSSHIGPYSSINILNVVKNQIEKGRFDILPKAIVRQHKLSDSGGRQRFIF